MPTKKCPQCKKEVPVKSKKCSHCDADIRNLFAKHKIITILAVLFVAGMITFISERKNTTNHSTIADNTTSEQIIAEKPDPLTQTISQAQTQQITPVLVTNSDLDPVSAIQKVLNPSDTYELTIWTVDDNLAKANSKPPFEVIINTSNGQISDCFAAKNILFGLMKTAYTNDQTKDKISRLQFTAWGQLKASLGSKDAVFNWNDAGPTNFWTTLQKYKSYVDEISPMDERTFGVRINKSCE